MSRPTDAREDLAPRTAAPPPRRRLAALPWLLLGLAAADWVALKTGWLPHPPEVLAALATLAILSLLARFLLTLRELSAAPGNRRRGRLATAAETLLVAGLLAALAAGSLHWARGVQGFVVLYEGEAVPLDHGSHLQELTLGPLARLEDLDLVLGLEELELRPLGGGAFSPRSRLRVEHRGTARSLEVGSGSPAAAGPFHFYQGAFGFAPRIVLVSGEETVFDRVVPFTTERRGPNGVTFAGVFTVERESLTVHGEVDLASLDEGLRGHATLHLTVLRDGGLLGRGSLLPGHFADLGGGWRVGFAGLSKWSEVDVARRGGAAVLEGGLAAALAGALLWPLAVWRGW
jgi:hypothetical protein